MSYPGSKGQAGTFQRIIGQMPPHRIYVEAFCGSGYVFRTKRPAKTSELIDLNPQCLKPFVRPPEVCCYQEDALLWLDRFAVTSPPQQQAVTVIYCDPPYLLSTRQGRFYYEHEMSDEDHLRLLATLKLLKANVLISGYPSELYSSQLQDWRCLKYRAMTRGGVRTECLWCNFPEPTELHDWRFAGKNHRERTSLKRLAARWLAKLENMQPRKRGYVLNAIADKTAGRASSGV